MFQKGFIAITTTIILSIVMLLLAVTIGSTSLLTRSGTIDFENKKLSYFLARSCLDIGLLKLAVSPGYAGNETVSIDTRQCAIQPIESAGGNKIIKANASVSGATTNLKLTVDASTLSTVSLEELASF